jgi:hypothetical protein
MTVEGRGDGLLERVALLTELLAAVARELRHALHQQRQGALRAQEAAVGRAQRVLVDRALERRLVLLCDRREARRQLNHRVVITHALELPRHPKTNGEVPRQKQRRRDQEPAIVPRVTACSMSGGD